MAAMLSRFLLAAAIIHAVVPVVRAEQGDTPQQLLDAILAQHDFLANADYPFILDADFTGQANVPLKGHLRLQWGARDRWWVRVDFGPFQQIVMRDGEREYTQRNAQFTPLQVRELLDLFSIEPDSGADKAHRVTNRVEAGKEQECLQARRESMSEEHEFCFDLSSHDLLSESWKGEFFEARRQSYSEYAEVNGMRYPRKLAMRMDVAQVVSAQVTSVKLAPFDLTLMQPPADAIERRKCADLQAPIPKKKKILTFVVWPRTVLQNVLTMTVLADGSVSDVNVIVSGGSVFDKRSIEVLSEWKFKPAMCGKEPVADDLTVEIDYQPLPRSLNRHGMVGASTVKLR